MIRIISALMAAIVAAAAAARIEPPVVYGQQDRFAVATLCTPYPMNTRPPITVRNGAELQNALDDAQAGDTILLPEGAVFEPPVGSFVLRNRSIPADQWVVIRSASSAFNADGQIPPNRRVTPADAKFMPQLRTRRANEPVFRAAAGAHGYRLVGLDIGVQPGVSRVTTLVELGSGDDTALSTLPHDIVIDRSYLHANDSGNFRRGVALNGSRLAIIESHLENFHEDSTDSQAIAGWNGPGPFKIVNNFLEAASENVMFGGADPRIADLVPADIEIRRNLMTKRLSWRDAKIAVKNAFELKSARRVLVDGNIFEHVWTSGQDGTAIVLKSTNQDGRCPQCVTEYVTFQNNIVRHAASGLLINAAETGRQGAEPPQRANNIRVHNVLFLDIGSKWGSGAKLFRIFGGVSDVSILHVTSTGNARGILDARDAQDVNPKLVFGYNLVERQQYGIGAGGDEGVPTLSRSFPQSSYKHNVLVNTSETTDQAISDASLKAKYPPQTTIARDWDEVAFQAGTYRLAPGSPFRRVGDDGKDPGVDWDALEKSQAGPGGSAACAESISPPGKPRQRTP